MAGPGGILPLVQSLGAWQAPLLHNRFFHLHAMIASGQFIFDVSGEQPTVTQRLIDEEGAEWFEIMLTRSQVTPK